MEPRDETYTETLEVVEVISAEPMAGAELSDVAEAMPGVVVARETAFPSPSPPQAGEGRGEGDSAEPSTPALHRNGKLKHVLECMLFVSTEPLSAKQLADSLDIEPASVEEAMTQLEDTLDVNSGLQLMHVAGGYQLCTRPEYGDYCAILLQPAKRKLSKAALETLAVVAYRQPATMPEVEAVRGVSVGGVMKTLMERGLVREVGHKQAPGRPMLYATTPEFLEYFGLNDIAELPDIDMLAVEEVRALEAQRELFQHGPFEDTQSSVETVQPKDE